MVTILMMSAKLATLGLLKIKLISQKKKKKKNTPTSAEASPIVAVRLPCLFNYFNFVATYNKPEHGFSHIRLLDFVLTRENTGQIKPAFSYSLRNIS